MNRSFVDRQVRSSTINKGLTFMADAEMSKFNKTLEKLCIDCGADVGKLLAGCRSAINSRIEKMAKEMTTVPVPNSSPADLDKVPAQVSAILKRESSRFASICTMTAAVRIDKPGGKLSVPATGVSGPMATV
jgi:hypothetical protein